MALLPVIPFIIPNSDMHVCVFNNKVKQIEQHEFSV